MRPCVSVVRGGGAASFSNSGTPADSPGPFCERPCADDVWMPWSMDVVRVCVVSLVERACLSFWLSLSDYLLVRLASSCGLRNERSHVIDLPRHATVDRSPGAPVAHPRKSCSTVPATVSAFPKFEITLATTTSNVGRRQAQGPAPG